MATIDNHEVIIYDGNAHVFVTPRDSNAQGHHGLMPRDYSTHPIGCYSWAKAVDFPLIPQSEWATRLSAMEQNQSRLSDVRMTGGPGCGMIPARDQNGKGYCWAHSGVSAHLIVRALMNEPYADLSAYAIACIIKSYRDEGGWGAQGVDWEIENGCPTSATWAQQSMSRSNDTPAMRADAARHKILAQWADMNSGQYDRNLSWQQFVTLWLNRCPTVNDYNWWSHSVCGIDLVNGASQRHATRSESGKLPDLPEFERIWAFNDPVTAGFGCRILNSWGDSWSQNGTGILTGSQAVPDGGVGVRLVTPS